MKKSTQNKKNAVTDKSISRRKFVRLASVSAGVAAGSGLITGFPAVHSSSQVTLRYLSTAVNQHPGIAKKAKEVLGINVQYIPVTTDEVTKRIITQPNSFDIVDSEYFSLKKLMPTGNLVGIDAKKIKEANNIVTAFTKGEVNVKKLEIKEQRRKRYCIYKALNPRNFRLLPPII